jgi:hypothetical protein
VGLERPRPTSGDIIREPVQALPITIPKVAPPALDLSHPANIIAYEADTRHHYSSIFLFLLPAFYQNFLLEIAAKNPQTQSSDPEG